MDWAKTNCKMRQQTFQFWFWQQSSSCMIHIVNIIFQFSWHFLCFELLTLNDDAHLSIGQQEVCSGVLSLRRRGNLPLSECHTNDGGHVSLGAEHMDWHTQVLTCRGKKCMKICYELQKNKTQTFNSLGPRNTYIRHQNRPSLVQIGTKPLFERFLVFGKSCTSIRSIQNISSGK